jgi:hypothetical protein
MFWVALGLFAGSAYCLFRHVRRRRWVLTTIAGGGIALSLTAVAAQTWFSIVNREIARANAECATAPKLVPFHNAMTLCPGQSTILRLEIPTAPSTQGI